MFARFLALVPLAYLAAASHLKARGQCNTGNISCCNSVQTLDEANNILSLLNLVDAAAGAGGLVGLTCTSVAGGGCAAQQQPVCCDDNHFNGFVNIGCSPINVIV